MNPVSIPAPSFRARGHALVPAEMRIASITAILALVLAWLLPNHVPPWMFFLQEAVAACGFALLAIMTLWRARGRRDWRLPDLVAMVLTFVVAFQYLAGAISHLQTAWMSGLYLLGFLLASQTGATLERCRPGRALTILAIGCLVAGVLSMALQAWQLFGPGSDAQSIWVYRGTAGRPAANIGQPNLLATVQVIGLLGAYWLWRRQRAPSAVLLGLVVLLLIGIALTQSRTGLVNIWIVCLMLLNWNRRERRQRWLLPALGVVATGLFVAYMQFGHWLSPGIDLGLAERGASAGSRPFAWRLFADAIAQRPFAGYGWGQTFAALLAVAPHYPMVPELWLQTHNLMLDLAVWNGVPIALVVICAMCVWLVQCLRRAYDEASQSLLLVVLVVSVHAMLEYPLTYSFVLLPIGFAAGALGERVNASVIWRAPRHATLALLVVALMAMALTVRDYLRVEHSYRQLLLEKARIQLLDDRAPPETWLLTSLRDLIILSRLEPAPGMTATDLEWMAEVVRTHPGAHNFAKVARALALNGREVEAQLWVDTLCRVFSARQCAAQAAAWAEHVPALSNVQWPGRLER